MKSFAGFEVWIRARALPTSEVAAPKCEVQVSSSPAGTALGELHLNPEDPTFQRELVQVSGVLPNLPLREKFGGALFDSLFRDDVLKKWNQSWGRVDGGFADGLSLSIAIDDADLALLPWELLHDPEKGFLATSASSAVARYLNVPEPPLLVQQRPLRILVIVESPKGNGGNGLAPISQEEQSSLKNALDALGGDVSYRLLKNPSAEEIQTELRSDPHVIHFLGHGTSNQLALIGKDDEVALINDVQFGNLFRGRRSLRLVVLNACNSSQAAGGLFSGIGPALVRAGLPAVVAMQYPTVQLETAGKFSRTMYNALANGLPVDVAVNEGRNLLAAGPDNRDWSTPVLYLGTRSGRILDFPGQNKEVVENAWGALRVAAQESGSVAAITQLSQRFTALSEKHRTLRVMLETYYHLRDFRASCAQLYDLVARAHGDPAKVPFADIKPEWTNITENQWQQFSAFLQVHEETTTADWHTQLLEKHVAINTAIARIALGDLQTELNSYKELLARTEAQLRQRLEDAVADLVSFSDQTLPLLSTK
jgi:hypothetical protein